MSAQDLPKVDKHAGTDTCVSLSGCYCALTVATLLNILTPELAANTSSFIASCQTYEGGLASSAHFYSDNANSATAPPLGEAHGGYAFCAVASWAMLRPFASAASPSFIAHNAQSRPQRELDLRSLTRWSSAMQASPIEGGGFRGRTNKLVDGCYSWWCGGLFGVLGALLAENSAGGESSAFKDVYDRRALQEYVLLAAQAPHGGLRDKPGKGADAYHTCYNLSGFSAAQHKFVLPRQKVDERRSEFVNPFEASDAQEADASEKEKEVDMILSEGESEKSANVRMRELWARSLGWQEVEKVLVGGEDNEVVSRGRTRTDMVQVS